MKPGVIEESVCIPEWVKDLESFRRWSKSDEFPEQGRISYLRGNIWVDMSMERVAHNQVKTEVTRVLGNMAKELRLGRFFADGMRLVHVGVELSCEPDAMFVSLESWRAGRVVLQEGPESLELVGIPDMVLEVVSDSSERKDTVDLRERYWDAEIPEYWLIDPRGEELRFDILRRAP